MKSEDIQKVSALLTCNGIKHDIAPNSIIINRDSIVNKIHGTDENNSYDQLIDILNTCFEARFNYVSKTDEWLRIDRIA